MVFRSRTVVIIVILSMVIGGVVTQTAETWSSLLFSNQNDTTDGINIEIDNKSSSILKASGLSQKNIDKIASTYYIIDNKFYKDIDKDKIVDGAINGMLAALEDPYSVYMDEEQAKQFTETTIESSFSGIGAEVTLQEGSVTVISPIKGSPADKAGIQPKDKILSVNGQSLDGLSLNEAVMKIRGPKGTQAKLEILRAGSNESVEITVVRDQIDLETIYSEMLEGNIGKIEVRGFSMDTTDDFIEQLAELEEKGMTSLIIDVRNNPGGILQTVIAMVEPFIKSGKIIVQTEDRNGARHPELSKGKGKDYPVAVLINHGSASASEILAAALKESAGSTLVGETTYGKGSVQTTYETGVNDGSNIKITIAKWLTPKGNLIHEIGVVPDIVVEQPAYFKATPLPRDTVLKFDQLGNDVKSLQLMLDGLGFTPGRTDGYFNKETVLAVEAFQESFKLPITGHVDEKTAEKIEQEIISAMLKPENDKQLIKAMEHLQNLLK